MGFHGLLGYRTLANSRKHPVFQINTTKCSDGGSGFLRAPTRSTKMHEADIFDTKLIVYSGEMRIMKNNMETRM